MNKFIPLKDRVLIRPVTEYKSNGGLFIPENALENPIARGVVVSVNHENKLGLAKNDVVMFQKFSGQLVTFENTEHLLVNEFDILAVIE
jgi:co-chaperonin GroES (HSP10)